MGNASEGRGNAAPKKTTKKKAVAKKKAVTKKAVTKKPATGGTRPVSPRTSTSQYMDEIGASGTGLEGDAFADDTFYRRKNGKLIQSSGTNVLANLPNRNPQQIRQLQEKLLLGGFYGNGATRADITWGVPDAQTQAAYEASIGQAQYYYKAGKRASYEKILDDTISAREQAGLNKNLDGNAQITLTNPEDVKAILDQVAAKVVGRKVSGTELGNEFVAEYNRMQTSAGTVAAPDVNVAAENFLRKKAPQEAQGTDIANVGSEFFSLLGAPEGLG